MSCLPFDAAQDDKTKLKLTIRMFHDHPKLEVNPSDLDKRVVKWGWGIIVLHFLLAIWFYFELPDTIPVHYNAKGVADGFGSKSTILILPILNLVLYYVVAVITFKVKPYKMNYPTKVTEKNAPKLYKMSLSMIAWISLGVTLLFLVISLHIVFEALDFGFIDLFPVLMGLTVLITVVPFYIIYKMIKVPKA